MSLIRFEDTSKNVHFVSREQIISLHPTNDGKETTVRLSGGLTFTVQGSPDDVHAKLAPAPAAK